MKADPSDATTVGRKHLPPILRSKFVAGLVILVPIVITVNALRWLFTYVDGLAQPAAIAVLCARGGSVTVAPADTTVLRRIGPPRNGSHRCARTFVSDVTGRPAS